MITKPNRRGNRRINNGNLTFYFRIPRMHCRFHICFAFRGESDVPRDSCLMDSLVPHTGHMGWVKVGAAYLKPIIMLSCDFRRRHLQYI